MTHPPAKSQCLFLWHCKMVMVSDGVSAMWFLAATLPWTFPLMSSREKHN